MAKPLAVLIVEDNKSDAQLLVRQLTKAGYSLTFEQVETAEQMRRVLEKQTWEMVISDFSMPEMDGFAALKVLQETGLDIPFIAVSGTMGEETAVAMMKAGAQDYVMKGNLARLAPAVERELDQVEVRRERMRTEEELRSREQQYRTLLKTAMDGFWLLDMQGGLLEVNDTYCRMSGYSAQELLSKRITDLEDKEVPSDTASHIQKIIEKGEDRFESRHRRKDGSTFEVEISVQYRAAEGGRFVAFLQDISERRRAESINRLITETQDILLRPCTMEDIYKLVSDKVRELIGDGITATSRLDEEHQTVRMVSYQGLDVPIEKLISILGIDANKDIALADMTEEDLRIYRSGRLEILEGGIYSLVTSKVPKPACLLVEKLLRVKKILTMGFVHENKHLGGLIILARSDITPFIHGIEQIVELATSAMGRKKSEEALKESNELLSLFMKHSPIYCFIKAVTPSESRNLNFSDNFQDMLGIPASDMVGKTMAELFPADLAAKMTADDWAVVTKGVILRLDEDLNGRRYSSIKFPIIQGDRTLLAGYTIDITERKQAEDKLVQTAEQLALAQHSAGAGVWDWDITTGKLNWSAELYQLFGLTPGQTAATFDVWNNVMHPDDRQNAGDRINEAIQNHKPLVNEYRIVKPSGEIRWINALGDTVYDEQNKAKRMSGICIDITDRVQAEAEIQSLARFPSENPGPILRIALDGTLLYVNPSGLKQLPEWHLQTGQAALPMLREAAFQAIKNGKIQNLDLEYGEQVYLFYVAPITAAGYANLYGQDISERKQAEILQDALYRIAQAADRSESPDALYPAIHAIIQEVMAADNFFIALYDENRDVLSFPYSVDEVDLLVAPEKPGKSLTAYVIRTAKSLLCGEALFEDLKQRGEVDLVGENSKIWLGVPLLVDGKVIGVMSVQDYKNARAYGEREQRILEFVSSQAAIAIHRKRAEEKILQLNAGLEKRVEERTRDLTNAQEKLVRQERLAVLGQISGSVSHELRNPLGVISNAIYFLNLVQPEADEKIKKYHAMIEKEVQTADKIIGDLLDFARLKSLEREPLAIAELVQSTLKRYPVPESIAVKLKVPPDLPLVFADPRQMEQVLGNLVTNACQAMSQGSTTSVAKGGKLTISVKLHKQMVAIAVKDNGEGILAENMKNLFEPLFTTKIKGIGLGLAVSKKLAEANGGRIEVQSEPGKGSTFMLWLPIQDYIL